MSALLGSASPGDVVLFVAQASSAYGIYTERSEKLEESLDFIGGKYEEEYGPIYSIPYLYIFIQSSNALLTIYSDLSQFFIAYLTEVSQ
jgi:hypothetical protein